MKSTAAALLAIAVAAPSGALASTTVIDFESFAVAVPAYSVSGVTFTSGGAAGFVNPVGGPNGSNTLLGNYIEDEQNIGFGTFDEVRAEFDEVMGNVSVDLGDWPGADQDEDLLFLEIFDAFDASLGRTELLIGPEEPSFKTLSISGPGIKYAIFGSEGDGGSSVYADNFTFGTAVPEPGAWALMILGFGGVGAMVRRRRVALA